VKGTLGEGVLPSVLRELYVGRKTGVLRFTQGSARRKIHFVKGSIVNASSELPEEHLGEVLVRLGRLPRAEVDRAGEKAGRESKRLGETLMELGIDRRGRGPASWLEAGTEFSQRLGVDGIRL